MIPWNKIEMSPEKSLKIEGRLLLDIRAKTDELEKELAKTKEQLQNSIEELKKTSTKLYGREKSLVKMNEKFTASKKKLDLVSEQKLVVDIKLTKLEPQINDLQAENRKLKADFDIQISELNAKITELQGELKFLNEKNAELTQQLIFKSKAVETHKKEVGEKMEEFSSMKVKLNISQQETQQLVEKIKKLEKKLSEIEGSPRILNKINEMMVHKGFLSDRELSDIKKEFE
ncbi:MAG: hypothetical protein ACTSPN_12225 [Promethearchaeota archaeon]